MRVITSSSWVDSGHLAKAEEFALNQADFAWNKTANGGRYRMGRDFWSGIGLEPAPAGVKQMLVQMFQEPETWSQRHALATLGVPFDLD
ncbi:hypothetical protein HXX76_004687 [Chlamydomonas incerta]|uniref:Uncharacterized protein n=1 Tax=Chlamydomonas incerta TaxID=51695 RepID=A0A835T5V6_CHLIN|nr:hypothetical protein HXX76_004687 [Chlamydomonas incerta]|eukprot:KAG2439328.1 hypothetical protein HXX76_004687 [Chlamydomonas incerta]